MLKSVEITIAPVESACVVKRPLPQPTSRMVSPLRSRPHRVSEKKRSADTVDAE